MKKTESQNKLIKSILLEGKKITSLEMINKHGVTRLASRIYDLKRDPFNLNIQTEYKTNSEGSRIAEYSINSQAKLF